MRRHSMFDFILGKGNSGANAQHHNDALVAAQKFDTDEIHVLKKTWQDLADRSDGKGVDKETFLQYFPLNGLLGERLFAQFDTQGQGSIDFDDFILGLATVCRGTMDEKIRFVFNMYDVSHDNTVSKQDLTTLLNQIPKGKVVGYEMEHGGGSSHYDFQAPPLNPVENTTSAYSSSVAAGTLVGAAAGAGTTTGTAGEVTGTAEDEAGIAIDSIANNNNDDDDYDDDNNNSNNNNNNDDQMERSRDSAYEDVDGYTNHDMAERAFAECDLNHEGRLTYEQFKMWVQRTPVVMECMENILPYSGPKDLYGPNGSGGGGDGGGGSGTGGGDRGGASHSHHKKEALPHIKRITSRASLGGRSNSVQDIAGDIFNHSSTLPMHSAASIAAASRTRQRAVSHNMSVHSLSMHSMKDPASGGAGGYPSPYGVGGTGTGASTPTARDHPHHHPPLIPGPPGSLSRASSFGIPLIPTPTGAAAGSGFGDAHNLRGSMVHTPSTQDVLHQHFQHLATEYDSEELARLYLIQAMECTQNEKLRGAINVLLEETPGGGVINVGRNDSMEVYRAVVSMEAFLWKKGKSMFHMLSKRYYLLSGNCMYYYTHKRDVRPRGVIFLTGFIIERVKHEEEKEMELKGYYGFEITHHDLCTGEHHRHDKRVLYCRSEEEREKWVTALQHAAHVVPIEDDYVLGKELGRGRFSVVCECVHKVTGRHCAVKIIDKATIEPEEKGLLRTEIAVLKLVNHPNIIRMEGLYESKSSIYIVMEMLKGGELFERIVGRPRFTEQEAGKLIRPLLESVAYLHDLGIVHRDLKPENILCGEELEDLKIADFGLSKMIMPKEKMDSACGTLSYVAPEVLTMQGYGKEADLWSVGVIMFLLICGKLPFDGDDHNEIIRSTIQADLKVNPSVWSKLSEEAKALIQCLLNKDPRERITARDALKHPFILLHSPHHSKRAAVPSLTRSSSSQGHLSPPPPPPAQIPVPAVEAAAAVAAVAGGGAGIAATLPATPPAAAVDSSNNNNHTNSDSTTGATSSSSSSHPPVVGTSTVQ